VFDVAIYTDTRADEAIDGIDGFNFQAASTGITAQDRQVIRDNLLHRVAVGWGVDHDPLDHPPTFACYSHGGRYYVSRGISTGVTNNGRPGNLLTQAITTSDIDDFGSMRPAQLFGAVNWRLETAPGKRTDQWAAPLDVDPDFQADALQQMVKEDPWAADHLPDFLSMVDQVTADKPKRLVLISSDQVVAQKWIALGTLFMDAQKALGLVIRGLVQDPMTTKGDMVAASPAFGPQPDATTPRASVNIVDLDKRVIGSVDRSESAVTQANWFLSEESASALSAVEVARRWEQFLGRDLATRAAAIASFPTQQSSQEQWQSVMQALQGLADCGQTDELFFYGDALLDSAVTYAPKSVHEAETAARVLLALLAVGSTDLAVGVLMPTLEAVSSVPDARDTWLRDAAAPESPVLRWEDEDARRQASAHASVIAEEVTAAKLPELFTVLRKLQIPLSDVVAQRAIKRLADLWVTDPSLTTQYQRWEYSTQVVGELSEVLLDKWNRGDQLALTQLGNATWSWLTAVPWPDQTWLKRLQPWFAAADLSHLDPAKRALALPQAGPLPAESWPLVWVGLALPADCELLVAWADSQHLITGGAGSWLYQEVHGCLKSGRPSTKLRTFLVRIAATDVSVLNDQLANLASETDHATGYFVAARSTSEVPNPYLAAATRCIPRMAALMVDHLGELILRCPDTRGVAGLVTASPDWAEFAVQAALKRRRDTEEGMGDAIERSFALMDGRLDAPAQAAQDFLLAVSDSRRDMAMASRAANHVDPNTRDRFDNFVKGARKGRRKRRFTRAAADLLGGNEGGS